MLVPDGWLQVIRGPRPKSEQWPQQSRLLAVAQNVGTPQARGRWRSGDSHVRRGEPNSVTALERALIVLGPEDGVVREGLEAAWRRAKDRAKVATPSRAPVPEVTFEAARVRVVKLEAALAALADVSGPEVDALRNALARAKVAASPPPVDVQLSQCQQFIERTVKRIEDLERSREVESVRLQEARDRLQRLQQEAAVRVSAPVPVATDASSEVLRLQNIVSQLQVQLAKSEGSVAGVAMDGVIQESPLKKGRVRPENFVCQTVEELIEWMDARQSDMRVAVEVGNASEVSRLAAMLAEGASQLKSWTLNPSMATNVVG